MKRGGPLLALVALAFAALALADAISRESIRVAVAHEHPDVPFIAPNELERLLRGPGARRPILLDARTPAEYAVSHLRGAVRIDSARPDVTPYRGARARTIVVYCAVGYRSGNVAEVFVRAGFRDVRNLEGGIFGWANEGREVVRGDEVVRAVHPYDATWGRLLRADLRRERP